GARILFISNVKQLRRIQPALDALKSKERPRLIMFEAPKEGKEEKKDSALTILADLEKAGREERSVNQRLYEQLSAQSQPDDLPPIIYPSATTGEPKAVMLTPRNLVPNALSSVEVFALRPDDSAHSFLPLSHVFERTVLYIYMGFGVQINFARGVE